MKLTPASWNMTLLRRCAAEVTSFGRGEYSPTPDGYRECPWLKLSGPRNTLHMQALAHIGEIAS